MPRLVDILFVDFFLVVVCSGFFVSLSLSLLQSSCFCATLFGLVALVLLRRYTRGLVGKPTKRSADGRIGDLFLESHVLSFFLSVCVCVCLCVCVWGISRGPLIQVRRQRVVEQEEMLKQCQQQTQQLESWLANIARTLDQAARLNDPSQLQVTAERSVLFCGSLVFASFRLVLFLSAGRRTTKTKQKKSSATGAKLCFFLFGAPSFPTSRIQ